MKYQQIIEKHNPSQSHVELNELLLEVKNFEPKVIVEIGSHRGGSLRVWRDVFHPEILIGINETDEIEGEREGFQMVFGRSQLLSTFESVKDRLNGRKIDFLFIDGSHYLGDVAADFILYSSLVEGGIVAFHDVVLQGNNTVEVHVLWDLIREEYKSRTIWDGTPAGTGTGLLWM